MTRQEQQFRLTQQSSNEFIRRFSERSADIKFPDVLQAFNLVKPAAADHTDDLFVHVVR
jgi:heme-degrading monooxygenase HmoA